MRCYHLMRLDISTCNAVEKFYVPSLFELEEYCMSVDYRKCPFYLRGLIVPNYSMAMVGD